ncbi:MAG: serine/threonine protein kinase [Phycisphaeraceae bacterium]|nr:serine/threonine protein kinase [Phycisphaeraceae bacterium]
MPEVAPNNLDTLIGRLVVEQGFATAEEVDSCRRELESSSSASGSGTPVPSLAQLLVNKGIVTQRQIDRIKPQEESRTDQQQIPGYQILSKLGAGAMATVYKARQISLDRLVAIKILPKKHTNNQQFVQRFYAEGKAAAKLSHPNIVGALDVGKAGEFHYFVMEYVEGKTVFDDLTERKRYTEKEALDIIIPLARALEHAHNQGFIHRDVKPKNIMITKSGEVKLADMGLARAVSDREAAEAEQGKAFGTPYYISPEQIRGEMDVDFRADIYGLGATFYQMVTGQVPFDGPNPSSVMHKHLKAELTPPDHINPTLSAGIGEIIEVCMAKDRSRRYTSTSALLADLEAVARGEPPVQARRKFDLSSLATLESNVEMQKPKSKASSKQRAEDLFSQPIFWIAVAGWGIALILLIVVVLMAGRS